LFRVNQERDIADINICKNRSHKKPEIGKETMETASLTIKGLTQKSGRNRERLVKARRAIKTLAVKRKEADREWEGTETLRKVNCAEGKKATTRK